MNKSIILLFLLFCSVASFSQKLIYKSNGNVMNYQNQKLSPNQVRELLKENQQLLADYNAGRTKKTAGNILLYGGIGIIWGKLLHNSLTDNSELVQNPNYNYNNNFGFQYYYNYKPRTATLYYVGLASIIVAIPVKIGFSKKIKNVVTDYNNQSATGFNNPKIDFITNSNGLGLRLTLN